MYIYTDDEREKRRRMSKQASERLRERKKNMSGNYIFRANQPASQPDSDANETAVAVEMAAQVILFIERLLVDLFIYITSFIYLYIHIYIALHARLRFLWVFGGLCWCCYCFNCRFFLLVLLFFFHFYPHNKFTVIFCCKLTIIYIWFHTKWFRSEIYSCEWIDFVRTGPSHSKTPATKAQCIFTRYFTFQCKVFLLNWF